MVEADIKFINEEKYYFSTFNFFFKFRKKIKIILKNEKKFNPLNLYLHYLPFLINPITCP